MTNGNTGRTIRSIYEQGDDPRTGDAATYSVASNNPISSEPFFYFPQSSGPSFFAYNQHSWDFYCVPKPSDACSSDNPIPSEPIAYISSTPIFAESSDDQHPWNIDFFANSANACAPDPSVSSEPVVDFSYFAEPAGTSFFKSFFANVRSGDAASECFDYGGMSVEVVEEYGEEPTDGTELGN